MKSKWHLFMAIGLILLFVSSVIGCAPSYTEQDLDAAREAGYTEGHDAGYDKAFEALKRMEEKIREGEWTEAIEKSWPVAELIRQEDMVRSILCKHGYHEDAADSLLGTIRSLFDYSSKFLHKVDKDGGTIPPEIKAEKEDAYLTYSVSAGLVNLLTQKANKPESQQV